MLSTVSARAVITTMLPAVIGIVPNPNYYTNYYPNCHLRDLSQ